MRAHEGGLILSCGVHFGDVLWLEKDHKHSGLVWIISKMFQAFYSQFLSENHWGVKRGSEKN